jgi:hypothetical protein
MPNQFNYHQIMKSFSKPHKVVEAEAIRHDFAPMNKLLAYPAEHSCAGQACDAGTTGEPAACTTLSASGTNCC